MKSIPLRAAVVLLLAGLAGDAAGAVTLQITKGTNSVLLSWATAAGKGYTVQSAASISGPWTGRTVLTAASSPASWRDTNLAGVPQRFYRLLETPGLSLTNLLFAGDGLAGQLLGPAPFNDSSAFAVAAQTCAYAVFLASQLNGGNLTATGTLTQHPGNTFTYTSNPNDRLVIQYTNGAATSFYVTTMLGDFNFDYTAYLQGDHYFVFRFVNPGILDMTFGSYHSVCGTNITAASGTIVLSGLTNRVDLNLAGTYCFQSDSTGSELDESHTMTGTITNLGATLTVNQSRAYVDVVSNSSHHESSSGQDANSNRLNIGNDVYQWSNYYRRRDFTNGHPVYFDPSGSPSYWQATGGVLKNGAGYATHVYNPGFYLVFQLATPTDTIELERYSR